LLSKALDGGLAFALDGFDMVDASDTEWHIRNIEVDRYYAAAIAVRAQINNLRLWSWANASGTAASLVPQ
jgi:hypothetical protein